MSAMQATNHLAPEFSHAGFQPQQLGSQDLLESSSDCSASRTHVSLKKSRQPPLSRHHISGHPHDNLTSAPSNLEMVLKILSEPGDGEGYEAEYDLANPRPLFHGPGATLAFPLLVIVHVKQADRSI